MKIIGHRGAAGLELENTLPSFQKALALGVDLIEFDVHLTKDGQPVVTHDSNLERVGGGDNNVGALSLAEVQKIRLSNGGRVPSLSEVLQLVAGQKPVVIEVKAAGAVEAVLTTLKKFPGQECIIASPIHSEIAKLKQLRPDIKGYPRSIWNPLLGIFRAKQYRADGLDLYDWMLNPITYGLCRLLKLEIMVFTVNTRWVGEVIRILYPRVMLCTNYPDRFVSSKEKQM